MNASTGSEVFQAVEIALREDIGTGDRTTEWTVPPGRRARAEIVAKADGVIAGTEVTAIVFDLLGGGVEVGVVRSDGARVRSGDVVLALEGPARTILTGERVTLNFMQRLSGVATLTRAYVDAIEGTTAAILDTRKTTPGLRSLERAAVRAGGGRNHRFGLFDMVLIKENHIRAAGGIARAIADARRNNAEGLRMEVETTTLQEVETAAEGFVDRILFDNMPVPLLAEAVAITRRFDPRPETEASGGITLETVRAVAETGVDYISVGALTHSAPALDLSLLVEPDG